MEELLRDTDRELFYALIWSVAIAMSRMTGLMAVLPLMGRSGLQGFVRTGVVLALSLPLIPNVADSLVNAPLPPIYLLLSIVLKEIFVGFLLGLVVSLPIFAMQMAGGVLDMQRGAMMANETANTGTEATVLGGFFAMMMITYMLLSGAFLMLLDGYVQSLLIWPPLELLPALPTADAGRIFGFLDTMMGAAILIASPIIIAMLVAEVGLAITTRFAPGINVFILALGIKSIVIFLVMPLYMIVLGDHMDSLLARFNDITDAAKELLDLEPSTRPDAPRVQQ